jgi:hypothetical protein
MESFNAEIQHVEHSWKKIVLNTVLITILLGALAFLMVNFYLDDDNENEGAEMLNSQFLPIAGEGKLEINSFVLCESISDEGECVNPSEAYDIDQLAMIRLIVKTSVNDQMVKLYRIYRLEDEVGKVIYNSEEDYGAKDKFSTSFNSDKESELVAYIDSFYTLGYTPGEYNLVVTVKNNLFEGEVSASTRLVIK